MKGIKIKTNPKAELVFKNYPDSVRNILFTFRELVFETLREIKELNNLKETLISGEPSYLTKYGITLRVDWKLKSPNKYALYFQCNS